MEFPSVAEALLLSVTRQTQTILLTCLVNAHKTLNKIKCDFKSGKGLFKQFPIVAYLEEEWAGIVAGPRMTAVEHVQKHTAAAPDVCF